MNKIKSPLRECMPDLYLHLHSKIEWKSRKDGCYKHKSPDNKNTLVKPLLHVSQEVIFLPTSVVYTLEKANEWIAKEMGIKNNDLYPSLIGKKI